MKIKCDVCYKAQASVFCSADEAALCDSCDRHVHHANKLASKHLRFSLLHPKHSPLCDICKERKAFLFCQEDRAILCRECDIPIHRANEHTKKHSRYLLTGVKLSASSFPSSLYTSSSSSSNNNVNENMSTRLSAETPTTTTTSDQNGDDHSGSSTSSISEYLETLPGWRVDDFLDPSNAHSNGVNVENQEQPFCWWV
ncbi:B-box zinc finger protein 20 [Euphorbia lathyris]|uniref:B-box zinc finger protein 20 n=1 Tax=Euphorbia lathyris TaxID=212925 RepID=UPI0033141050